MILSLIALSILILVHELGHFVAARWKGVSVAEFVIGYGPKLFAWTWGQTVFVLRAFPIGGYIKQHELALRPAGQKILVYLAGPAANLLFAYLAFLIAGIVGIPQLTTKIGMVFPDMPAAKAGCLPGDMVESVNGIRVERWVEWTGKVHESRHSEVVLVLNRHSGLKQD